MKIERTKNAVRNVYFGIILKIYQILVPFLIRTAMIYLMGMEYVGLNTLFTSILQVLNLAELGVGSAMVYSMYEPVAKDDIPSICALMKLYRLYYRVIGIVVGISGLILLPALPHLVKADTVPAGINIYILYLFHLGSTVLSYWLFAYKNSILTACQRTDIISKITLFTNTLQYLLQLLVLLVFRNYYYFVLVSLLSQAATNIITAVTADRLYPDCRPYGELPAAAVRQINRRVRDLFTSKLGSIIITSADSVVISAFLGLHVLAVYQNYYYILVSVISTVSVIFNACTAGIGNSIILETEKKNYSDLKNFTFLIAWLSGFCSCCLLCLYQPFMELWTGKENMLDFSAVICLVIYYFIYELNQLLNMYKDAAGIWHEDRFRPLVTAVSNLCLNLILVQFWGIYGVLLSTVLTMLLIGMPWLLHNLFTVLFKGKCNASPYVKRLFFYGGITCIAVPLTYQSTSLIRVEGIAGLLLKAVLCCIVSNLIFLLSYRRLPEFKQALLLLDRITHHQFSLAERFSAKKERGDNP